MYLLVYLDLLINFSKLRLGTLGIYCFYSCESIGSLFSSAVMYNIGPIIMGMRV